MEDYDDAEATVEYYIVRIYRRGRGSQGEEARLTGTVEDTEGRRLVFADSRALWGGVGGEVGEWGINWAT